jgi:Sulfotransferase family
MSEASHNDRPGPTVGGLGENLVFIVGCPRSGTTWVQRLLAMHPKVIIGQESFVFSNYVAPQIRTWRWELRREMNPAKATGRGGVGISAYLHEEQFLVRLKSYADDLLQPLLHGLGPGDLFVDKSSSHARCIPEIKQLYPGARFIHVLRDPRDVVASWQTASRGWGKGWATGSSKVPTRQWLNHVGAVREAERWLHSWDFFDVVYERLYDEPVLVVGELSRFLGLSWDEQSIQRAVDLNRADVLRTGGGARVPVGGEVATRTGSDVMRELPGFVGPGRPGTWKTELNGSSKAIIWRRARQAMKREGYRWTHRDWLSGRSSVDLVETSVPAFMNRLVETTRDLLPNRRSG